MAYHIVAKLLASQEHRRSSQVWRLAQPSERDTALHILPLRGISHIGIIQLGANRSGKESIATNSIFAQCNRTRLHQTQDTGLGGSIVCLFTAANKCGDGANADDRSSGRGLDKSHLPGSGLRGEEGAGKVGGNGVVEKGGLESMTGVSAPLRISSW